MSARSFLVIALLVSFGTSGGAEVNVRTNLDPDELAECLRDSGALFYGAHWCPNCRKQLAAFPPDSLPYVECYDGPRSAGSNATCRDANVSAYPTWVFADGSRRRGALPPAVLAAAAGCY